MSRNVTKHCNELLMGTEVASHKQLNLYAAQVDNLANAKMKQTTRKMTETLANGDSSERESY